MNSFDERLWNDESAANSYDESYDESGYDESSYDESSYDDHGGDSAEFLSLLPGIGTAMGVGGILNGIRNIVGKPAIRPFGRPNPPPSPGGLPSGNYQPAPPSNIQAQVQTANGVRALALPDNIVTKDALDSVVRSIGADIRRLGHAVRRGAAVNAAAIGRVNVNLAGIEKKNNAIEARQTEVLQIVNRRVNRLKADQEAMKQQTMMMTMFSLLSPPELRSVTFGNAPVVGANAVTGSDFESGNLLIPMMMMSGMGNSGDSSNNNNNNMMNNPMMLLAMTGGLGSI